VRMVGFGVMCLFFATICLVPTLSSTLQMGDDLIGKRGDKRQT